MAFLLLTFVEYVGVVNLLSAITVCLLTVWFIRKNWSPYNLPPGPPQIPFPFNALLAFFPSRNPIQQVMDVCKKYGDITCLRIGTKTRILVSNPGIVKDLLVKQADVTSNREIPIVFERLMDYTGGIIFSHGEIWQETRRFTLSALRNFGMGKRGLEYKINEEAHMLREAISRSFGDDKPLDPSDLVNNAVSNVICSITFGRRFDYSDPAFKEIISLVKSLVSGAQLSDVGRELLQRFPRVVVHTPFLSGVKSFLVGLKDFINKEVAEHVETFQENDIRDIIDMYLAEVRRLETSGEKMYLDKRDIWMCVFDLFLAGTETTSSSLMWFFLFMAGKPDIQRKVIEEVDSIIGRERAPTYEDRKNMPYTEATLIEILRFRPIAPLGVQHVTSQDIEYKGYTIPKDTEIIMNILGIHLDSRYWKEPDVFNPNRFLSEDGKTFVKQDAFIPFGAGRRVCLGEQLARMEFFLFATNLLQRFTFHFPDGVTPDYGFSHRISTLLPKNYEILAKER